VVIEQHAPGYPGVFCTDRSHNYSPSLHVGSDTNQTDHQFGGGFQPARPSAINSFRKRYQYILRLTFETGSKGAVWADGR
jgi:hypothetical protein